MDNDNEQLNKVYEQLRDWIAKYPGLIELVPSGFPIFAELRNTAEAYHDLNGKTPAPEEIRNAFEKTVKIMSRKTEENRADGEGKKQSGQKRTAADTVKDLAGSYFSTPQGLCFFIPENPSIPIEIDSEQFAGHIADMVYATEGTIPGSEIIESIRRLGRHWARKNVREIGIRFAREKGAFYWDPVNNDASVYRITQSGIELIVPDIPVSIRFPGMLKAKVRDGKKDDLDAFFGLWNLGTHQILAAGWLFAAFIADIPHAILDVNGTHGSGKTTFTAAMRQILDPSGSATQSLKYDERDLTIAALHQGVLAFDNVNTVMPNYISDVLCRMATGQGYRTRELYSNTGEIIINVKKAVILNGINLPGYNPDFLDRSLPLTLGAVAKNRITEAEIQEKIDTLMPSIRGFIISAIPMAMRIYDSVAREMEGKLPRMADFVLWAECGCRSMGFPPLFFFNTFTDAKNTQLHDVAFENTLIEAITALMAGRAEWTGTSKDLLEELRLIVGEIGAKRLPKDERRLGRLLRELTPTLIELGIEISEDRSDRMERKKVIRKIDDVKTLKRFVSPEIPKVIVSNVGMRGKVLKSDVQKSTLDTDNNFSEKSYCRLLEPTKSDLTNNTDIRDNRNDDSLENDNTHMGNGGDVSKDEPVNHGVQSETTPGDNDTSSIDDVQSEKPNFHVYRVVKTWNHGGYTYRPGTEFIHTEDFEDAVKLGFLKHVRDDNDR